MSTSTSRETAMYVRVSSTGQDHASQLPDLERWASVYAHDTPVQWYHDTCTGKTMNRKEWRKLHAACRSGRVQTIVVWRMDRLGRTAAGLTALFDELIALKINLVSVKDGVDLSTPAGRLLANVLASVAAYENEVRSERVRAGIEAAKAKGKRWGGSQKGVPRKLTPAVRTSIRRLHASGLPISEIARSLHLSRQTVYAGLRA